MTFRPESLHSPDVTTDLFWASEWSANEGVGHATGGAREREPLEIAEHFLPNWTDYRQIADDLEDDSVSAPPEFVEGMRDVVGHAADNGIDLKIVYTPSSPAVYTGARDLATMLGEEYDGTILVRTPIVVGSHSDSFTRAQLEAGQDDAWRETDPVASAYVFQKKLAEPAPPWGVYSAVILTALVLAVVAFVVLLKRRAS